MIDSAHTRKTNAGRTGVAQGRVMRSLLVGAALAAMLVASVAAAAGNRSGVRVVHAKESIESFAISGHRIAYDLRGLRCNRIMVLDLRSGKTALGSGKGACSAGSVRELAIARTRIAWIVNDGGNTESHDYLNTSSLLRPSKRRLAAAHRFGEPQVQTGDWIGNPVASGDVLAVGRWSTEEGMVVSSAVDVITRNGLRLRRIGSSRQAILDLAADGGRIAVLHGDSSVAIYALNGKRLLTVKAGSASKEIALLGEYLLALTEIRTLEIYNARTGAYLRSRPVQGKAPAEVDAYGGVATYVAHPQGTLQSFKIHAVQLKTGKDVVIASGSWWLKSSAQLEPAGLLYARDRHNLVLVPFKNVLAAVS